jgi:hypothetical protein
LLAARHSSEQDADGGRSEPWFVQVIEPNLAGATAEHWHDLLTSSS